MGYNACVLQLVITYASGKKKGLMLTTSNLYFIMVPKVGLEPTRYHYQRILSPSRLPFHHFGISHAESLIIIVHSEKKSKHLKGLFENFSEFSCDFFGFVVK